MNILMYMVDIICKVIIVISGYCLGLLQLYSISKVFVLKLSDCNCLNYSITSATPKKRLALSSFIATMLLVGIAVAGTAVFFPILNDITNMLNQNTACYLTNLKLYKITSASKAYFMATLQNSGDTVITDVTIRFIDDFGKKYGFYSSAALLPGSSVEESQGFAGVITRGNSYLVDASIAAKDGSRASCTQRTVAI